ncbi:MAG: DUF2252 domain-containing protein [Firmicutes bacterium]|nr:DUF2252 domain-containing protein [Bacillota bacterium]
MDSLNSVNFSTNSMSVVKPAAFSQIKTHIDNEAHVSDGFVRSNSGPEGASHTLTKMLRDPEKSVGFNHEYNKALGLKPDDLKAKYDMMKEDVFSFYRITNALFYNDIHGDYAGASSLCSKPAPEIYITGDAHWMNLGTYRGADGEAVWGFDDFDQATKGSPEWDLERLAVSAALALREQGGSREEEAELVKKIGKKYIDVVSDVADTGEIHPCYLKADETHNPIKDAIKDAGSVDRKKFLKKILDPDSKAPRFVSNEKIQPVTLDEAADVKKGLEEYQSRLGSDLPIAKPVKVLDIARKLGSGGSSYGLDRYYVLVAADKVWKEPFVLEIKQLLPSAVNDQSGNLDAANGKEIVDNIRKTGGKANPLTGYTTVGGKACLVRELEPEKAKVDPGELKHYDELETYFTQAAKVMAYSHCQSKTEARNLRVWIGDEHKQMMKNLESFAMVYADQVEADFGAWKKE